MPPASPIRRSSVQAASLALIAGYVDGYSLRLFGTYVSFMSGNTTIAGTSIGESHFSPALPAVLAIVSFLGGGFTGTWITHSQLRSSRSLLFGASALLLATFIGLNLHTSNTAIPALSFAMGLINPAMTRVGSEPVSITFVTGTLNKIGAHLALAARRLQPSDAEAPSDTHLRRAALESSVWIAFFTGAILSGIPIAVHLGSLSLLPASIALLVFALQSFIRSTHKITASP
jgi:uncharacterized membrane protein YoaK (UPF0700 family)